MFKIVKSADAWIQRHFDKGVHHIMRQYGWTKRRVRFNINCAMAVSQIGELAFTSLKWPATVLNIVNVILFTAMIFWHDSLDAKAEIYTELLGTPVRSNADGSGSFSKIWALVVFLSFTVVLLSKEQALYSFFYGLFAFSWAASAYLCFTRPEAPKKEEEKETAANLALSDA